MPRRLDGVHDGAAGVRAFAPLRPRRRRRDAARAATRRSRAIRLAPAGDRGPSLRGHRGARPRPEHAPACTAFATAAALDHALARWSGRSRRGQRHADLVALPLARERRDSLSSNVGQPLGPEQHVALRRRGGHLVGPVRASSTRLRRRAAGRASTRRLARRAESRRVVGEFTEVEYLRRRPTSGRSQAKIAAGQDIIVTHGAPDRVRAPGARRARVHPALRRARPGPTRGTRWSSPGTRTCRTARTSSCTTAGGPAGATAATRGSTKTTIRQWVREVVALDAEPVERDAGGRPRADRAARRTCDPGLVPDSIRATCAPVVPRRQPAARRRLRRRRAVPRRLRQPDRGVRPRGAERRAARTRRRAVAWTCGPGGCSYDLPRTARSDVHRRALPGVVPGAGLHPRADGTVARLRGVKRVTPLRSTEAA